ncbi:MOSC N-terminal beta barrel domain-containing protein [Pelagophyceae sp. CCMP2097]|nr:MOSC N-terminal beta barrel domain-containing protein [Pelagophyceae sp. CCMP2097]|mmetsp:Transcript_12116/g.42862  ORF Transcript_12116/g.42862 Transcript_12116/m.42862 type:complete len:369 (+) Transcript_12116:156-1262(+)
MRLGLLRRALMLAGLRRGLVVDVAAALQPAALPRIVELRIYPIKSCGAVSLESCRLGQTGLENDRVFAVVDENGIVQTQRQRRLLATVRPKLDVNADTMTLSCAANSVPPLTVSLSGRGCAKGIAKTRSGLEMPVFQYDDAVSRWLTSILSPSPGVAIKDGAAITVNGGVFGLFAKPPKFHLVRFDAEAGVERRVLDFIGGDFAKPEDVIAFPDLFPLLLTCTESLDEVNKRLPAGATPAPMDRFRPNIIVSGASEAFDEDAWAVVDVCGTALTFLENDPRCQVPSIDQSTGKSDAAFEPTTALRQFRRLDNRKGQHGDLADEGPMFGIYGTHGKARTELRVGDEIQVVERSKGGSLHEHWASKSGAA